MPDKCKPHGDLTIIEGWPSPATSTEVSKNSHAVLLRLGKNGMKEESLINVKKTHSSHNLKEEVYLWYAELIFEPQNHLSTTSLQKSPDCFRIS